MTSILELDEDIIIKLFFHEYSHNNLNKFSKSNLNQIMQHQHSLNRNMSTQSLAYERS